MERKQRNRGVDRLSDLPDDILGHILSYLATPEEAGRAAVLCTRWRYIFAHVHTLSFNDDDPGARYEDNYTFEVESEERRSPNGDFVDRVNDALLCHLRCAGLSRNTSLRAFRVAIDEYEYWDEEMVYMWVSHALQQSPQELHFDLRLHYYLLCQRGDGQSQESCRYYDKRFYIYSHGEEQGWKGWDFTFPRTLFNSTALRSLRVSHCVLNQPEAIRLPSLETLHLTAVGDSEDAIHRLVSSCPRLADLTLESCSTMNSVSVLDKRLRRFALRCCHSVARVSLDTSEQRFLDYRGAVPTRSMFTFRGSHSRIVPSCTIDLAPGKIC